VVEEDEGPDHAVRVERQHAPHLEAAEVLAALVDDEVDHRLESGLPVRKPPRLSRAAHEPVADPPFGGFFGPSLFGE